MARVERVAHNREVVLSTAREVFAARGYAAATLDQIAEAAGFSKGVVYSQFENKADLFLTVLERRVEERAAQNRKSLEDLDGPIELDQLVEGFVESMLGNDPAWRLAVIEVRVAAARDEALLDRYRQVHARTVDLLADVMAEMLTRVGIEPVAPPTAIASLLLAVDVGIVLETAASPGVLGRRELVALIRQMIFGGSAPTTTGRGRTL
jgi:AcrR family transcriptional regulator